jgi:hypothetical protein
MTELVEKKLLGRVKAAVKGRASAAKSFGRNFAYYAKNPDKPVPGNSPEERDARRRYQDYLKSKQQREAYELAEGFFGPGSVRHVVLADYPLVHAYATGIRHQSYSNRGDVNAPQRKHVLQVGKKKIPVLAHQRIKNFEALLQSRGHGEEWTHVAGVNHGTDFKNNPTKHDEVLEHSAADVVGKKNAMGQNSESLHRIARHGIAAVRALTGAHKVQ